MQIMIFEIQISVAVLWRFFMRLSTITMRKKLVLINDFLSLHEMLLKEKSLMVEPSTIDIVDATKVEP